MEVRDYNRLYLHIVLRPSDETIRAKLLLSEQARQLIVTLCRDTQTKLISNATLVDHIHLVMLFPSAEQPQSWVRKFKALYTRRMNAMLNSEARFSWERGYRMYSVSPNRLPSVVAYLRKQESFHAQTSFAAEMDHLETTCEVSLQVMERQIRFGKTDSSGFTE